MRNCLLTFVLLIALIFSFTASSQLIINEIMQSNIDCIMDDLNEFPDSWVELYNPGTQIEYLDAYKICDKDKIKKAYQLPDKEVRPGEFIIIYCDKEDQGLHTSFRLESGKGGNLYLFKDDQVVDKLEDWEKQPAPNIAYGRVFDGSDDWGYMAIPTPGNTNCGIVCKDILGQPVFSSPGKVFSEDFDITLSLPENAPNSTLIRYTLDGKEPDENSNVYYEPIKISRTTILRAKLFCDGYLSPRSVTHSYINHGREVTLPVVSIVSNRDYFYDDTIGIYIEGSYNKDIPNFKYDWRRPVNCEYFDSPNTESVINQLCEARVKGGATRRYQLKSLALYANKRFGAKRFNYEFFPDQTPEITEFKSFEMRNAGNDFEYLYMRDAIIQESMGMNSDLDWQPSRPVIFYLNGQYKGILNIRPRSNEDYVYSYYSGLEDIDIIENWKDLKEGTIDSFNAFKEFYNESGHSYSEFQQYMDTEEFCNLMIMNIFFDNKDFPGNNIVMWRPSAGDGKWRWIAKDTDFGLGLFNFWPTYPTLDWITTPGFENNRFDWANKEEYSLLFRRLLETPDFMDMFIDNSAVYLGDFLSADAINERIDNHYDKIKYEYQFHSEIYSKSDFNYENERSKARNWTNKRVPFFYQHLADFFNLNQPVNLTIDKGNCRDRILFINDVPLVNNEFDGMFFCGRNLEVKSLSSSDGMYVNGWEVKITTNDTTITEIYNTEILNFEMPTGSKVEISSILSTEPLATEGIYEEAIPTKPTQIFDLTGRYIGSASSVSKTDFAPGAYILRQGKTIKKIILK